MDNFFEKYMSEGAGSLYRLGIDGNNSPYATEEINGITVRPAEPSTTTGGNNNSSLPNFTGNTVYERALTSVLSVEGGYVWEHAGDGTIKPTQRGITLDAYNKAAKRFGWRTYSMQEARGPNSLFAKAVTREVALQIYKVDYWDVLNLDKIAKTHPKLALAIIDSGINSGTGRPNRLIKENWGISYSKLNSYIIGKDDLTLALNFAKIQQDFRESRGSSYNKFKEGWRVRYQQLVRDIKIFR